MAVFLVMQDVTGAFGGTLTQLNEGDLVDDTVSPALAASLAAIGATRAFGATEQAARDTWIASGRSVPLSVILQGLQPEAAALSDASPLAMVPTASAGVAATASRADHQHPRGPFMIATTTQTLTPAPTGDTLVNGSAWTLVTSGSDFSQDSNGRFTYNGTASQLFRIEFGCLLNQTGAIATMAMEYFEDGARVGGAWNGVEASIIGQKLYGGRRFIRTIANGTILDARVRATSATGNLDVLDMEFSVTAIG